MGAWATVLVATIGCMGATIVKSSPALPVGAVLSGQYGDPTVNDETKSARLMFSNGTYFQFGVLEGFIGARLQDEGYLDYPGQLERFALSRPRRIARTACFEAQVRSASDARTTLGP
jgi:hypothetical protein